MLFSVVKKKDSQKKSQLSKKAKTALRLFNDTWDLIYTATDCMDSFEADSFRSFHQPLVNHVAVHLACVMRMERVKRD